MKLYILKSIVKELEIVGEYAETMQWHPIVMMASHSIFYLVTGRSKSEDGEGIRRDIL